MFLIVKIVIQVFSIISIICEFVCSETEDNIDSKKKKKKIDNASPLKIYYISLLLTY